MTAAPAASTRVRRGAVERFVARVSEERLRQTVRRLPRSLVRAIVGRVAEPRELGPYPGWTFQSPYDLAPTGAYRLRRSLWDRFHEEGEPLTVVVPWVSGLTVEARLGNDLSWPMYVGGCIEPNEMSVIATALAPGMTFVDIGANEGLYTLLAARCVGPTGRVVAVEPSAREIVRAQRNVARNRLAGVTFVHAAVADREGTASLNIAEEMHAGQNSLGAFAYDDVRIDGVEHVMLTTVDSLTEREGIASVDVIKIDVEGAEAAVLKGSSSTLARSKPMLIVEVLDAALRKQGSSSDQLLADIFECGYSLFTFDRASGRPRPIEQAESVEGNIVATHHDRPWDDVIRGSSR